MKYLQKLLSEAASLTAEKMSSEKLSKEKLQPEDRLLGTVPEDVQRFYHLYTKKAKAINREKRRIRRKIIMLSASNKLTQEKKDMLEEQLKRLTDRLDIVEKLFWFGVKDAVPGSYAPDIISLRKDWNVVGVAPKQESPFDLLGSLLSPASLTRIIYKGCGDPNCPACNQQHNKSDKTAEPTTVDKT